MSDQGSDHKGFNDQDLQNENENGSTSIEKMYSCKFCDKVFSCRRVLGGHQSAHRKERSAEKSPNQQTQYDPFDPFSLASSILMPCPYMEASNYLRTQWQNRYICPLTNRYRTHYHTYHYSPNCYFGPNVDVPAKVNPSLRLFGNSLYGMHVSRGLKIEKDESFKKYLNEYNSNYGSLYGEKENREEELDLSLHL